MELNKQIFLENLPKKKYGDGFRTDWKNSIGHKVNFIYGELEDYFIIVGFNEVNHEVKCRYKNNEIDLAIRSVNRCGINNLIETKILSKFRIEIGQTFKDEKRDLTIINREYRETNIKRKGKNSYIQNQKWYKYKCNICGYDEGWIEENKLISTIGCACCSNQVIVKGINDIATTNPEMVKYFVNIEDAYTHSYCSNKKVWFKCLDCDFKKEMKISDFYKSGFRCKVCGDGVSYPEKVMINLLKELEINFKTQLSKTTFKWCKDYYYDFYFEYNDEEYIVETHGLQHYEENTNFKMSLEEQQINDENKKELAIHNGVKLENYIVVDCRYSNIDFIKNSILNSMLNKTFDLDNINWKEINEQSQKSLVKKVCDYWYIHNEINGECLTVPNISKTFNLSTSTIYRYLRTGENLGWCIIK